MSNIDNTGTAGTDLVNAKRMINGETVSGNRTSSTDQGELFVKPVLEPLLEAVPEKPVKRSPGRPRTTGNAHYSRAELATKNRRDRERERDAIRDERAFERETEKVEREYEQERLEAQRSFEASQLRAERNFAFERQQSDFDFAKAERELARTAKRAEPIDALQKKVLYGTLALSLLILVSSAIFSFVTIAAAGEWLKPPLPWLVWLLPVATEFFIVFGGMDTLISQAKGDKKGARIGLSVMIGASLVAVVANGAHTLSEWLAEGDGALDWRAYIGIFLSALIPIATVVASKRAIKLVFESKP